MKLIDRKKETYDLKIDVLNNNIQNTWDLMNKKIDIYESRIKNLERFIKERLNLISSLKEHKDGSVYTIFIDKLNSKVETLTKELNTLKIENDKCQFDRKLSNIDLDLKIKELDTLHVEYQKLQDAHTNFKSHNANMILEDSQIKAMLNNQDLTDM